MAEAFGIAASVAGIVSLSIELSTRISTYIDAVKRCEEEISAVHVQAESLQRSLDVLKNAIPDLTVKHQSASDAVLEALKSVERELQALKDLVDKLTASAGQPQSLKSNLKHAKRKMTFPSHRDDFEALQKRLDRVNVALDAATHTLGLAIVSSIDRSSSVALSQLSSLSTSSADNLATSSSIKTSLHTFIPHVEETLLKINSSLSANFPNIEQHFASISTTISRQEENITRRIQEVQAEVQAGRRGDANQGSSIASAEGSKTLLGGLDLLNRMNGLSDIVNDLAEKKDSDPPLLANATAEQRALYRLITSPAQLEKICTFYREGDGVEHEFTITQRNEPKIRHNSRPGYLMGHSFATSGYMSSCICQQHRESIRQHASLTCQKHLPECRFAKSEVPSNSKSIRFSYSGLRWLLSKAVDISVSLSTGAGGFSISPNITIRPTVDETQAPIFQSLEFLCESIEYYFKWDPRPNASMMLKLLEVVVHRIMQQYMSRKRSPHEVNSRGQSVLHRWIDLLCALEVFWDDYGENFTMMTKLLLEAGLSVSLCDDQGASPGTRLLRRNHGSVFALETLLSVLCEEAPEVSVLCEEAPEPLVFVNYNLKWLSVSYQVATFMRLHDRIEAAEVLGCGTLSSAILLRDEAKVKKIISLYPSTLLEKNLLHQTPFHLAADKPRILRILMAAASSQELDQPDSQGDYALDYAMFLTPSLCLKGNPWEACSNCSCCECVEIFLHSGWRYTFTFLNARLVEVSYMAKLEVIDHIISEREVLKSLGRQFLPSTDIDRYRLNEPSILDTHAHRVAELLRRDHVSVRASIWATFPPLSYFKLEPEIYHGGIYHFVSITGIGLSDKRCAQLLYDKGFLDVNEVNAGGHSPLSLHIYYCRSLRPRPSYAMWLIKNGANILQRFPVVDTGDPHGYIYGTRTVAQSILYYDPTSIWFMSKNECEIEPYRQLVLLVAPLDVHDECHCRCIEAGCHTMKVFFEGIWQNAMISCEMFPEWSPEIYPKWSLRVYCERRLPIESTSMPEIVEYISTCLRTDAPDLSKWDKVAKLALRYFTFEVLDLQHTCCWEPWTDYQWSEEETKEIEDEHRERLDLLEVLLEDFQVAYCAYESQDGQGKFTSFLTREWSPRMQQVLAGLESVQLTAEEKLNAEEIGVRWQPASEDLDEEEAEDPESLEYWLKRLDEIMPA
ncbi:hypothetical protein GGR55DRAFT_692968 [Xylaria sp. FL0064]|nr:hypothetical protein GGR55DRAFT_692968 [Xylaria sp. FL0064]